MTRINEPQIGTTQIPNYKSPPSRILRSLRNGYDNVREKVHERSETILELRGKLRDTQKSREEWKTRAKQAEMELKSIKKKNVELELEAVKKKSQKLIRD